ncbi:hypothetical protein ACVWXM_001408 [Bradyrhizobium sp. GM7.3]
MMSQGSECEQPILDCARQYACLVAAFPYARREVQQSFIEQMEDLLSQGRRLSRAVRRRRQLRLPDDIRSSVVARRDIKRPIGASEVQAIQRYYSTPSVCHLANLTGDELSGMADLVEGWAHDKRLDARSTIELLGWADGMRSLVAVVGINYTPLPLPEGTKSSLHKFLASRMLRR